MRLAFLCLLACVPAFGQPFPPMYWGDDSRLGRPFAKDPCVVSFKGRYLLFYSLPPFADKREDNGWAIGIAESADLLNWKKITELAPEQACERKGFCAPGALVLNGRVHLFYQTYGNGAADAICHAVSDDGVRFQRDASNPVFHPNGDWTCGRAIDAEAIADGSRVLLYFATRDPAMKVQMVGVAAADKSGDFSRGSWKLQHDGPILKPELPWEKNCIEAPTLCRRGGMFYMFYAGAYNNEPQQIGVASSADGVHFTRLSDKPLLPNGQSGQWNSSESGHPGVFMPADGPTWLFFQGNNDRGKTWFLSRVGIEWTNRGPTVVEDRPMSSTRPSPSTGTPTAR